MQYVCNTWECWLIFRSLHQINKKSQPTNESSIRCRFAHLICQTDIRWVTTLEQSLHSTQRQAPYHFLTLLHSTYPSVYSSIRTEGTIPHGLLIGGFRSHMHQTSQEARQLTRSGWTCLFRVLTPHSMVHTTGLCWRPPLWDNEVRWPFDPCQSSIFVVPKQGFPNHRPPRLRFVERKATSSIYLRMKTMPYLSLLPQPERSSPANPFCQKPLISILQATVTTKTPTEHKAGDSAAKRLDGRLQCFPVFGKPNTNVFLQNLSWYRFRVFRFGYGLFWELLHPTLLSIFIRIRRFPKKQK